jgi:hypothetical protein
MGPFAYVATSLSPRTIETAVAMGFAVDDQLDAGAELWEAAQAELDHRASRDNPELHARYQRLISADNAVAALGRRQAELWQSAFTRIPDGGDALFVTHGAPIEPGLIVALPQWWDHTHWARGFRHWRRCEAPTQWRAFH